MNRSIRSFTTSLILRNARSMTLTDISTYIRRLEQKLFGRECLSVPSRSLFYFSKKSHLNA